MGFAIGIIVLAAILVIGPMMWLREGSQPISRFKQVKPLRERDEEGMKEEDIEEKLAEHNGKKKGN